MTMNRALREVGMSLQTLASQQIQKSGVSGLRSRIPRRYRENEVLSHITHDLRAPLSAIMGYLDLAGRQVGNLSSSITVEYLTLAREAGKRMNQMVNDMQDMFRFQYGRTALQMRKVPLARLFQCVRKTFSGLADLKNVKL